MLVIYSAPTVQLYQEIYLLVSTGVVPTAQLAAKTLVDTQLNLTTWRSSDVQIS
jgi:hypothetical protein